MRPLHRLRAGTPRQQLGRGGAVARSKAWVCRPLFALVGRQQVEWTHGGRRQGRLVQEACMGGTLPAGGRPPMQYRGWWML